MNLFRNITIRTPSGRATKADIEQYSRGGTLSPTLSIFIINGKRLAPIQWQRQGYFIYFDGHLQMYMPFDLIKEELRKTSWFLKAIEKDHTWTSSNYVIPMRTT